MPTKKCQMAIFLIDMPTDLFTERLTLFDRRRVFTGMYLARVFVRGSP